MWDSTIMLIIDFGSIRVQYITGICHCQVCDPSYVCLNCLLLSATYLVSAFHSICLLQVWHILNYLSRRLSSQNGPLLIEFELVS